MSVSLQEIMAAAGAHAAPFAAESAGYLLLAVADHVLAAPRVVLAEDVELLADGSVRLRTRAGGGSNETPERATRRLLARALEVASSVGPALRRAAERREDAGLPSLVRELETALIPVNRAAARRALARLFRETERAKSAGRLVAPPTRDAVDAPAEVVGAPSAIAQAAPAIAQPAPAVVPLTAPLPEPGAAPEVDASVEIVFESVAADDPLAMAADDASLSPAASPVVPVALPVVKSAPLRVAGPAPSVPAVELTPEPRLAVGEPALTKPEPVVQRAKERGNATPRLGTMITLQTLPGEEAELTERAPTVALDAEPQPFLDPEPSRLPDILTAMVELHTGVDADEAPTRIRDVVTELRTTDSRVRGAAAPAPSELALSSTSTPGDVVLESVLARPAPPADAQPLVVSPIPPEPTLAMAEGPLPRASSQTPEPDAVVEDAWLTHSSLSGVESGFMPFEPELAEPAVHEALTWDPGPVKVGVTPVPAALLIAEPLPEPSPYAPAVLPARTSDVSELLDTFYVSDAAEERELRSALKGMAGLDLTPMPHPYVEEG